MYSMRLVKMSLITGTSIKYSELLFTARPEMASVGKNNHVALKVKPSK